MRWFLALSLATGLALHATPSAARWVPPVLISDFGTGAGPLAVACDASGDVFVSDADGNLVREFTRGGTLLAGWGVRGRADGQV